MRENRNATEPDKRAVLRAGQCAQAVKTSIDAGNLQLAEEQVEEGFAALVSASTWKERELSLTLQVEHATITQYAGHFDRAAELAEEAVRYADRNFGSRGIQIGRARLRHHFAMEARREFADALKRNLELDKALRTTFGSEALRLNCLTRAIACSVKNADRAGLHESGLRSEAIREVLDPEDHAPVGHHSVLRWHYFWCAVASLRQGQVGDAEWLLDYASGLEPITWRWDNAASFVKGYGLTLSASTASKGYALLQEARVDAEARGFHGLVRSIDAGFSSPGL